ncbi:hypothetical protein RJ639_010178 [Escallonia herrerae]|uniref:Retroviral polymerase SH3-like domain-containing protein n=1 Tax=Escallonia herrerae TaxID=1293975 RepID=A0AA89ARX8_9ASTE|nr:hypothetical protein RJ639_010178 [Escallonia herrerae]
MCMEASLQGQDLWDLVSGADLVVPDDIPDNAEARQKWKIKCGKALFALRTSISKEYIDHVRDVDSPRKVWETLERLFTKKNTARLQLLENDLATLTQGDMDDPISEARLRRYLIRGLRKEYIPFVTSVQGWAVQPSVEELENILSNQEALAKKISRKSISEANDVLVSKWKLKEKENSKAPVGSDKYPAKSSTSNADSSTTPQQKYSKTVQKQDKELGASDQIEAFVNYVDYKKEWILDSGCSHHVIGNSDLVSNIHKHNGDRVIITVDNSVHPVVNEDVMVLDNLKSVEADIVLVGENKELLFVMSAGEAYVEKTNTPQQKGAAKQKLGHLAAMSLSWLHDKNLPRELWAEAVCCACHVINRLPSWPSNDHTPFEALYKSKPNVNYFRVFGSICYVHIPKSNRTKLDPKAKKCIFVAYDSRRKGWRCMNPETKKFLTSRDVVFDEVSSFPKGVESAQFLPETSPPSSPIRQIEDMSNFAAFKL